MLFSNSHAQNGLSPELDQFFQGRPVLGLERRNLFVNGGQWEHDAYIPAYVRRYPFGFIATTNPQGHALAIDAASDRLVRDGEDGTALFEDSKPSALTKQALEFCTVFGQEVELTRLFATALTEQGLLIDRRADATLPDGSKLGLDGFQIVDAEKFAALEADTIVSWQRQGLLALVHHHLSSLQRFSALLDRHAVLRARDAAATGTTGDSAATNDKELSQ